MHAFQRMRIFFITLCVTDPSESENSSCESLRPSIEIKRWFFLVFYTVFAICPYVIQIMCMVTSIDKLKNYTSIYMQNVWKNLEICALTSILGHFLRRKLTHFVELFVYATETCNSHYWGLEISLPTLYLFTASVAFFQTNFSIFDGLM